MKIDVNLWQDVFTGDLVKDYYTFKKQVNEKKFIQACTTSEQFFNKFIRLYAAIDLMKRSKIDKSDKKRELSKDVADFKETQ